MRVALVARNHMPVQVRRHISEAREVDFVRFKHAAQRLLNGQHHAHAVPPVGFRQIGHFPDMFIPDHAAEAGIVRVGYQHDPAPFIAPQDFAADLRAKLARWPGTAPQIGDGIITQLAFFHAAHFNLPIP